MEAIAGLSLACNIVQLLDFSIKTAEIVRQIYKKTETYHNADIRIASTQLLVLCHDLDNTLQQTSSTVLPSHALDVELRSIASKCQIKAKVLCDELDKLQATGGRLNAIKKAVRATYKAGEIEKLQTELRDYENRLNTGILISLRGQIQAARLTQSIEFTKLDMTFQNFANKLLIGQSLVSELIQHQHEATRLSLSLGLNNVQKYLDLRFQNLEINTITNQVLDSLQYSSMNSRINQIDAPQRGTYEWLFEENISTSSAKQFIDWLTHGRGLFWIQGKAGSGKSTFMKHLWNHQETRKLLKTGTPSTREPLIIKFSFWLSGDTMQRNLCGLMCSLLYQVLSNEEVKTKIPTLPVPILKTKRRVDDWSLEELGDQLIAMLENESNIRPVLMFVDGLDEFDTKLCEPAKLLTILARLSAVPNSKICVSSRPEQFWCDTLIDKPQLRLQDLTHRDIEIYVDQKFAEARSLGLVSAEDPYRQAKLVKSIVESAEGVFLWVHLAVKDVLRGLTCRADWDEIDIRIARLPHGIYAMYQSMLDRVAEDPQIARKEAALYLLYRLQLGAPVASSMVYFAMLRLHWRAKRSTNSRDLTPSDMDMECQNLISRIPEISAGLLVVTASYSHFTEANPNRDMKVSFSHYGVRDFLIDTAVGRALVAEAPLDIPSIYCAVFYAYCKKPACLTDILGHALVSACEDLYLIHEPFKRKENIVLVLKTLNSLIDMINLHEQGPKVSFSAVCHSSLGNHSDCSGFIRDITVGEPAADFLGFTLKTGLPHLLEHNCFDSNTMTRRLTGAYLDYSLLCTTFGILRREGHLIYVDRNEGMRHMFHKLTEAGANPYTTRYHSDQGCTHTSVALLLALQVFRCMKENRRITETLACYIDLCQGLPSNVPPGRHIGIWMYDDSGYEPSFYHDDVLAVLEINVVPILRACSLMAPHLEYTEMRDRFVEGELGDKIFQKTNAKPLVASGVRVLLINIRRYYLQFPGRDDLLNPLSDASTNEELLIDCFIPSEPMTQMLLAAMTRYRHVEASTIFKSLIHKLETRMQEASHQDDYCSRFVNGKQYLIELGYIDDSPPETWPPIPPPMWAEEEC